MLVGLTRKFLLMAMCGLCAPPCANSTETTQPGQVAQASAQPAPLKDTDTLKPATAPTTDKFKPVVPPVKIALLLPLRSEIFGNAAQAVRAGFQVAYDREPDGIEITILETADGPQNAVLAYTDALPQSDIVVGPLGRADVAAVAQSGKVSKPTLALALPENTGDTEIVLPPNMLAVGLSIEEEARQLASWAGFGRKNTKAFVISTNTAWQRRVARAFSNEWQRLGLEPQQIEITAASGYISAASLVQLKKRIAEEKPSLLFYALDAAQARQLQLALGRENVVYGTSQLNPFTATDWRAAERRSEMNGVRLLDLPWLLQPDHLAVMVYPRAAPTPDQRANPDLERLYALGIDAYRIAREIANRRSVFDLDGVTGRLTIKFTKTSAQFERTAQPAIYQNGMVAPYQGRH
ncbi:MAG: penicillin-binding protein activator [Burkholderiales bacterium]|nr:penicillin-binding protein activator [Burkholderiales bacterium]